MKTVISRLRLKISTKIRGREAGWLLDLARDLRPADHFTAGNMTQLTPRISDLKVLI